MWEVDVTRRVRIRKADERSGVLKVAGETARHSALKMRR